MRDEGDGPGAASGSHCGPPSCRSRSPGAGQVLISVARMRGLPHRPAHRRRGARRSRSCRWCSGTRSSARWSRPGRGRSASRRGSGLACPGWAGPAASAATAARAARTSATGRASPAMTSTAATPSWRSPTSASASRSRQDYPDEQAAPLLCAGLIGYRALRLVGDAERIGFYGFGASAHILCQVAVHQGRRVFAFTREGDARGPGVRARARRRVGGLLRGGAAGGARRRDRLRPGRRADDDGPARQRQGRPDHQRRHPHERHPRASPTSSSGASARSARSPT